MPKLFELTDVLLRLDLFYSPMIILDKYVMLGLHRIATNLGPIY